MCLYELEIEFAFVVFPSGGLSSLQDQCFNSVRSNSVRSSQHTPRLYQDYEIGTGKRFVCFFLFNFFRATIKLTRVSNCPVSEILLKVLTFDLLG